MCVSRRAGARWGRTRPDSTGPSVHARIFSEAIIGSSDSHNMDEKKVVFAYRPVSLSEAVTSIFHCRGGFLLSGTVFPIMRVNTVHHHYARARCVFSCQRTLCSLNMLRSALLKMPHFQGSWCLLWLVFVELLSDLNLERVGELMGARKMVGAVCLQSSVPAITSLKWCFPLLTLQQVFLSQLQF